MENNKNKKSVKFQGDMLNFCDFIQVYVFTRNHHLKETLTWVVVSFEQPDPGLCYSKQAVLLVNEMLNFQLYCMQKLAFFAKKKREEL